MGENRKCSYIFISTVILATTLLLYSNFKIRNEADKSKIESDMRLNGSIQVLLPQSKNKLGLLQSNEELKLENDEMSEIIERYKNETKKLADKNQQDEEELSMYREKLKILTERLSKMDSESQAKPAGPIGASSKCDPIGQPIDVVFTWVNGSDPEFQQQLKSQTGSLVKTHVDDLKAQRFEGRL